MTTSSRIVSEEYHRNAYKVVRVTAVRGTTHNANSASGLRLRRSHDTGGGVLIRDRGATSGTNTKSCLKARQ